MTQTKPEEATSSTSKWKTYPAYKDSGVEWLGEIPEHWEVKRLKHTAIFLGGGTPSKDNLDYWSGNIPWVSPKDMKSEIIYDAEDHITEIAIANSSTRLIQPGAVLIVVRSGIIRHSIPVAINARPVAVNQDMKALILNSCLKPEYLASLIRGHQGALLVEWRKEGATVESIEHELLVNTPCLIPPFTEQHAIATFLDRETAKINTLITKKERLIELLQEKRSALISHAVTKGLDPTVKMKDSGVEWLGEIPEHWKVRRLKYIASILRGKFSHRPRNDPRMYDGPYPFIQTGDITATAKYITAYQQTLNETGFAVSKQFPSGTLVMAIAANIGDLAILQFSACFPDSIVGFVPTFDVALDYLYYNLTSMKPEMLSTATLNTQLNLNVERIGGLITTCPPLREQIAIASYLEHETAKIDALVSRIRDGIEKLKEYSTALISAAVTGKIDVRGEIVITDDEI